jgi:hypothetical protein
VTVDLVDEPGHPTRPALERVMAFIDERLHPCDRAQWTRANEFVLPR